MVPLSWLAHGQWVASVRLESSLAVGQLVSGHLVLGSPAEVEGSQHWDVDAEPGEHQFDAAEHEGCEGCSGKVAEEIDDIDLPESDDADNYTCRAESEAGNDGQLLCLAHLELPD